VGRRTLLVIASILVAALGTALVSLYVQGAVPRELESKGITPGYTSLRQLAGVPRSDLAKLHGMGPKALRIIEEELERHGLALGE
jgi:hypothetical protein